MTRTQTNSSKAREPFCGTAGPSGRQTTLSAWKCFRSWCSAHALDQAEPTGAAALEPTKQSAAAAARPRLKVRPSAALSYVPWSTCSQLRRAAAKTQEHRDGLRPPEGLGS